MHCVSQRIGCLIIKDNKLPKETQCMLAWYRTQLMLALRRVRELENEFKIRQENDKNCKITLYTR